MKWQIIILLLLIPIVSAETTFFEGDYFILGEVPPRITISEVGGGGFRIFCNSLWLCEEWSSCFFGGVRKRVCVDINYCNSDEKPPLLLSCSTSIQKNRVIGCVRFNELNKIIKRWKVGIFRFDILDESIRKWKRNIDC